MNEVFFSSPQTGTLSYKHVYEFYEEPRFFSVEDRAGRLFIVYWADITDHGDKWFLIPVSENRLSTIERRETCIRDALLYQEENYFIELIKPYDIDDRSNLYVEWIEATKVSERIALPKQGLFVSNTPKQSSEPITLRLDATHEIHVQKNSKKAKALVLEQVSRIFDTFGSLYNSIADTIDISSEIQPVGARPGSFILSFNANNIESVEPILLRLFDVINKNGDVVSFVAQVDIDAQLLCNLLEQVVQSHSSVEIKRNSDAATIMYISSSGAQKALSELKRYAAIRISSAQVPQANDIEKMYEVVEKLFSNIPLCSDDLKLTERQIKYYLHAASTLGLVTTYGAITALGEQLAQASKEVKYKIAARSFQSSACGWAWICWADVENITQLDPSTAAEFLLTQCSSLSDNTSKRRATTLKKWCEEFTPYFSEW
ncbi:hypothetical protein GWZ66_15080 [Vibrio cholerae]|uniref:DUF6575 domain-containing protein n=1 Tax=Vibrio cholerae TaxID=666 RepID=UPI00155EBF79|nr:DUF6575 domain-containing protein [Vibrio cholerae]NOF25748.1 hypothetical protein [Vibrio cholerae]